jgi:hypothetical protein
MLNGSNTLRTKQFQINEANHEDPFLSLSPPFLSFFQPQPPFGREFINLYAQKFSKRACWDYGSTRV